MDEIAALPALTDPSLTRAAPRIPRGATPEEVRKVAEDFESFFVSQMFQHMFSGIETDGPFGGGHGEKIFRSLLIDEYGKVIGRQGGLGIADAVERDLLQLQEVEQ